MRACVSERASGRACVLQLTVSWRGGHHAYIYIQYSFQPGALHAHTYPHRARPAHLSRVQGRSQAGYDCGAPWAVRHTGRPDRGTAKGKRTITGGAKLTVSSGLVTCVTSSRVTCVTSLVLRYAVTQLLRERVTSEMSTKGCSWRVTNL